MIDWPPALAYVAAIVIGYLLGSIPFGLLVTRLAGTGDIRAIGSGNIGATNVLRTGRKALAAATLLGDMLKGTAAVAFCRYAFGDDAALLSGAAALSGHIFPVWLGFKGGKGVATYIGLLIAFAWPAAMAFCLIWLAVAGATRYSSLAGLTASGLMPVLLWFMNETRAAILFVSLSTLVWIMHRGNIGRLVAGTESKIGKKAPATGAPKRTSDAAQTPRKRSSQSVIAREPINWKELLGVVLAIASLLPEHTALVGGCLLLAVMLGCWGVATHQNLGRKMKVIVCCGVAGTGFLLFLTLRADVIEKELQQARGTLISGNGVSPESNCPFDETVIHLGQMNLQITQDIQPVLTVNGVPVLEVQRKSFNYLIGRIFTLSIKRLRLFDDSGADAVDIKDDKYYVGPLTRFERTGRDNLTVFDFRGDEIFYIEYINDRSIKVRGVFRDGDHVLKITDTDIENAVGGKIKPGSGCWRIQNGFMF